MKKIRVNVIGLGEIGTRTLEEMGPIQPMGFNSDLEFFATDVDKSKKSIAKELKVKFDTKPFKNCDVYIICVWTTDQIIEVMKQINKVSKNKHKIISIESTIDPRSIDDIKQLADKDTALAAFPHRYNPNDAEHGIFNQHRVLGVWPIGDTREVEKFYSRFMSPIFIIKACSFKDAVLSKVIENAYRYMEIVLAQEMSLALGKERFERVRELANTKWNIDIRGARYGVNGKCLPKDMELFLDYIEPNDVFGFLSGFVYRNAKYIGKPVSGDWTSALKYLNQANDIIDKLNYDKPYDGPNHQNPPADIF